MSRVEATVDGGAPVSLAYGVERPDVCAVWPGYSACAGRKVGFQGTIELGALPAKTCGHVLEVRAIDGDGNAKLLARRRIHRSP